MNNINYELEILGEKKTYKGREEFIRLLQQVENSEILYVEEELGNWLGVIKVL